MKFLVDAQLPKRLALFLQSQGHDAIHMQDLSQGNATSDADINLLSLEEERIVITKDADFVQSFLLQHKPYKLLLVQGYFILKRDLSKSRPCPALRCA